MSFFGGVILVLSGLCVFDAITADIATVQGIWYGLAVVLFGIFLVTLANATVKDLAAELKKDQKTR